MKKYGLSFFRRVPLLRLLASLIAGISIQYYLTPRLEILLATALISLSIFLVFNGLFIAKKFQYPWIGGVSLCLLFISVGSLLSYAKNLANQPLFMGAVYTGTEPVLVTLQEPLVNKPKSYKSLAKAEAIFINNSWKAVKSDVLVYFKKGDHLPLQYGSQLIITKKLVPIANAGNPGGFNYKEYCAFQGIYYQVFLSGENFKLLPATSTSWFNQWLINTRLSCLGILRKYITGTNELSVAEALLIGYRDDLDRDLVQAYSNTGVVHIIAISGLHLGMIYGLLAMFFKPFSRRKWLIITKPVVIIAVLWGFTFIAGAAPSILRSAVMFTFIVAGEAWGKRTSIYNTLAASAFFILVVNPFSLWDVGFQLSYAAVLSIVLFSKIINNWFWFQNKTLSYFWGLNAVTLSAQVLTLPLIVYHFHQVPTLFFVTNLIVVPLSGIILYGELLLLLVAFYQPVAVFTGKILKALLWWMNDFVLRFNRLPFAVWNGLQISFFQSVIMYVIIAGIAFWLLHKNTKAFMAALAGTLVFVIIRSYEFIQADKRLMAIVYNVPQHTAIDFIDGRSLNFIGDTSFGKGGFLYNFHLKPARVFYRTNEVFSLKHIIAEGGLVYSCNKKIFILDKALPKFYTPTEKIKVDAIIITKNPRIYFSQLAAVFDCKKYIFDGSNTERKIKYWKKDAADLHFDYYSVAENGAFKMQL